MAATHAPSEDGGIDWRRLAADRNVSVAIASGLWERARATTPNDPAQAGRAYQHMLEEAAHANASPEPGRETLVDAKQPGASKDPKDAASVGPGKWTRSLLEGPKPAAASGPAAAAAKTEKPAQDAPAAGGADAAKPHTAKQLHSDLVAAVQASKNAADLIAKADPATIVEALRELQAEPGILQKIMSVAGSAIERILGKGGLEPKDKTETAKERTGFSVGAETHHIYIDEATGVVMMASTPKSIKERFETEWKPRLALMAPEARARVEANIKRAEGIEAEVADLAKKAKAGDKAAEKLLATKQGLLASAIQGVDFQVIDPLETLKQPNYTMFKGRFVKLAADLGMSGETDAQTLWLDVVKTLQKTHPEYQVTLDLKTGYSDLTSAVFQKIIGDFDGIIVTLTPYIEKFVKGKASWAFWSGKAAKNAAIAHAEVCLESSPFGSLFDGININGIWDMQMWGALSRAFAAQAASKVGSMKLSGFVGHGSSREMSIFNKIEQPHFAKMLAAQAAVTPKITWYAVAGDPKKALGDLDREFSGGGFEGTYKSGDRGSMVAFAESENTRRLDLWTTKQQDEGVGGKIRNPKPPPPPVVAKPVVPVTAPAKPGAPPVTATGPNATPKPTQTPAAKPTAPTPVATKPAPTQTPTATKPATPTAPGATKPATPEAKPTAPVQTAKKPDAVDPAKKPAAKPPVEEAPAAPAPVAPAPTPPPAAPVAAKPASTLGSSAATPTTHNATPATPVATTPAAPAKAPAPAKDSTTSAKGPAVPPPALPAPKKEAAPEKSKDEQELESWIIDELGALQKDNFRGATVATVPKLINDLAAMKLGLETIHKVSVAKFPKNTRLVEARQFLKDKPAAIEEACQHAFELSVLTKTAAPKCDPATYRELDAIKKVVTSWQTAFQKEVVTYAAGLGSCSFSLKELAKAQDKIVKDRDQALAAAKAAIDAVDPAKPGQVIKIEVAKVKIWLDDSGVGIPNMATVVAQVTVAVQLKEKAITAAEKAAAEAKKAQPAAKPTKPADAPEPAKKAAEPAKKAPEPAKKAAEPKPAEPAKKPADPAADPKAAVDPKKPADPNAPVDPKAAAAKLEKDKLDNQLKVLHLQLELKVEQSLSGFEKGNVLVSGALTVASVFSWLNPAVALTIMGAKVAVGYGVKYSKTRDLIKSVAILKTLDAKNLAILEQMFGDENLSFEQAFNIILAEAKAQASSAGAAGKAAKQEALPAGVEGVEMGLTAGGHLAGEALEHALHFAEIGAGVVGSALAVRSLVHNFHAQSELKVKITTAEQELATLRATLPPGVSAPAATPVVPSASVAIPIGPPQSFAPSIAMPAKKPATPPPIPKAAKPALPTAKVAPPPLPTTAKAQAPTAGDNKPATAATPAPKQTPPPLPKTAAQAPKATAPVAPPKPATPTPVAPVTPPPAPAIDPNAPIGTRVPMTVGAQAHTQYVDPSGKPMVASTPTPVTEKLKELNAKLGALPAGDPKKGQALAAIPTAQGFEAELAVQAKAVKDAKADVAKRQAAEAKIASAQQNLAASLGLIWGIADPGVLDEARVKEAIHSRAPDCKDIADPLVTEYVGKSRAELEKSNLDMRHGVISKYLGPAPIAAKIRTVGSLDPIAIQKFKDVDDEAHLDPAHAGLKAEFDKDLHQVMIQPDFTDRSRTYPAMKLAIGYTKYVCKGAQISADRVSPHSSRNHPIHNLYGAISSTGTLATKAAIKLKVEADLKSKTPPMSQPAIDAAVLQAQVDEELLKTTFRHLLKEKGYNSDWIKPTDTVNSRGGAAWYGPGEIAVNPGAPVNQEFGRLMTLGALQPEWYPYGTAVLQITKVDQSARKLYKPTAFDGLMSALWTSRNIGAHDYGMTGGGLAEFLEFGITFADVKSASIIVPSDDFLANIQRVITQVAKLGVDTSPGEELLRGKGGSNVRVLNTVGNNNGGVKDMYNQVIGKSTAEQNGPSPAPNVPGAATPKAPALAEPTKAGVATDGAYDRINGPRPKKDGGVALPPQGNANVQSPGAAHPIPMVSPQMGGAQVNDGRTADQTAAGAKVKAGPEIGNATPGASVADEALRLHPTSARDSHFNPVEKVAFERALAQSLLQNAPMYMHQVKKVSVAIDQYLENSAAKSVAAGVVDAKAKMEADFAKLTSESKPGWWGAVEVAANATVKDVMAQTKRTLVMGTMPQQMAVHQNFINVLKSDLGDSVRKAFVDELPVSPNYVRNETKLKDGKLDKNGVPVFEKVNQAERGRVGVQDTHAVSPAGAGIEARNDKGEEPTTLLNKGEDTQRVYRGIDAFTMNEATAYCQRARLKLNMPLVAGVSGSTAELINVAMSMGLAGRDREEYALAVFAYISGGGNHSYNEIAIVLQAAGLTIDPDRYSSLEPFVGSAMFQQLKAQHPDAFKDELPATPTPHP